MRKSEKSANAPLALRVATIEATTFSPTLRTAVSPNRMSVPTVVKLASEELTSGGSTLMPAPAAVVEVDRALVLVVLDRLVSSAAMYSAG